MYIKEMSSLRSKSCANNTRSKTRMISNGKRTPEFTGILSQVKSNSSSLMLPSLMLMSSSELKKDSVSQVSQISATSLSLKLSVCSTVELQLVQPEQVRQKPSRISDVPSVFMSSSLTALMSTSTETWLRSSRVFLNLVFGVASMSSTESHSQHSLWSLLKSSQSLLLRKLASKDSCSQTLKSQSCLSKHAPISLQ